MGCARSRLSLASHFHSTECAEHRLDPLQPWRGAPGRGSALLAALGTGKPALPSSELSWKLLPALILLLPAL